MKFRDLVLKTRSYRRFDQSAALSADQLRELVDLARQTPSAANRQPLKYVISCGAGMNARIFQTLSWAGSLKDWPGPEESERPTGYIVILHDRDVFESVVEDVGIVAQTILLGAVEMGLGGCMFGSVRRAELKEALALPENLEIRLVVALGKPVEKVVLEEAAPGAPVTYYRDRDRTHHVPKRGMDQILVQSHAE